MNEPEPETNPWRHIAEELYDSIIVISNYLDDMPTCIEDMIGRDEWKKIVRSIKRFEEADSEELF